MSPPPAPDWALGHEEQGVQLWVLPTPSLKISVFFYIQWDFKILPLMSKIRIQ